MQSQQQSGIKTAANVVVLIILVLILVFALVWTGVMRCGTIPGLCDAYYSLAGQPKVLIVYGNSGLGNPELLKLTMADPKRLGVRAQLTHISQINSANLQDYQLVIVEKARKMSTNQMKMFIDYATSGGRLVWTGDAGTELDTEAGDELLYKDDLDTNAAHVPISPWSRKQNGYVVGLNKVIGVDYTANFCEVKSCSPGKEEYAGNLQKESTGSDPLVYGITADLRLYVSEGKDFAIVSENSETSGKRVLSLNYGGGSNLVAKGKNYGNMFPMIVSVGTRIPFLEPAAKVAYYAMPPDGFVEESRPQKYPHFIMFLYYAMFK